MNKTGFDPAKNMDSVFAQNTNSELDFDIMFDQEDQLIDIVAGFNEAGEPLVGVDFETLHQDSDEAKTSDFKKELETNGDTQGASKPEGTVEPKENSVAVGNKGESDASKFEKDADQQYQKEKLEPKQEGAYDLFGIFDESAPDEPSSEPVLEEDDASSDDMEDTDTDEEDVEESAQDILDEAAIELLFMEAEEGTAFNGVKDEDAESRNSKSCNCGKSNCPICGKAPSNAEGTDGYDENEVAVGNKGESDASKFEKDAEDQYQNDKVEPKQEACSKSGAGSGVDDSDDSEDEEDVEESAQDILDEAAIELLFMEAEESSIDEGVETKKVKMSDETRDHLQKAIDNSDNHMSFDELEKRANKSKEDVEESAQDILDEAAIELLFMEAEEGTIDSDVKKVEKDDDGDVEDAFVETVDKNKKKAGKLEYEYSDEELIDSLM